MAFLPGLPTQLVYASSALDSPQLLGTAHLHATAYALQL
jgi:hypothetical protein